MKIYAKSIQNISTPFDEFVGQDIWVRCYFDYGNFPVIPVIGFARFLSKEFRGDDVIFSLNFISDRDLSPESCFNARGKKHISVITQVVEAGKLVLVQPVYTCTTETLLSDYQSADPKTFEDFVGTDVWVLVRNHYGPYKYYIKVLSCNKHIMTCNIIDDDLVDAYEYGSEDYYKRPSECIKTTVVHTDTYEICEPLCVLGQEDIEDYLAYSDSIWEQNQ